MVLLLKKIGAPLTFYELFKNLWLSYVWISLKKELGWINFFFVVNLQKIINSILSKYLRFVVNKNICWFVCLWLKKLISTEVFETALTYSIALFRRRNFSRRQGTYWRWRWSWVCLVNYHDQQCWSCWWWLRRTCGWWRRRSPPKLWKYKSMQVCNHEVWKYECMKVLG